LEKVVSLGGSIVPPRTVVGYATLCENALYLVAWANAARFLEFSVMERYGYFWAMTLELACLSVKLMLLGRKGLRFGEPGGLPRDEDWIERMDFAYCCDFGGGI
jgi:hypothetical protein